jgi:hypothetical protein
VTDVRVPTGRSLRGVLHWLSAVALSLALLLVSGLLSVVGRSTTVASAATFSYDAPAVARVDAGRFTPAEGSPAQLSGSREESASIPVDARDTSTTPLARNIATEAGTDLVRYDPGWASRQLLGQNTPGSVGYAVTPGGRTVTAHAADVIANGGRGRPPTSLTTVDEILDTGTSVRWNPINDTVRVTQPGLPGRPFVAVDDATGNHIVTVMVPK